LLDMGQAPEVVAFDAQRRAMGRYSVSVSHEQAKKLRSRVGLCADCRFMRRMQSDRGSVFYLCERSATDPRFPKYPRLPVLRCSGYEPSEADQQKADR
jgi:hypothetical protein